MDSSVDKESACSVGDPGLIPGLGRSRGEKKGYPLQSSGLENAMDCIVRGVAKSQTQLNDFHFHAYRVSRCCTIHALITGLNYVPSLSQNCPLMNDIYWTLCCCNARHAVFSETVSETQSLGNTLRNLPRTSVCYSMLFLGENSGGHSSYLPCCVLCHSVVSESLRPCGL